MPLVEVHVHQPRVTLHPEPEGHVAEVWDEDQVEADEAPRGVLKEADHLTDQVHDVADAAEVHVQHDRNSDR